MHNDDRTQEWYLNHLRYQALVDYLRAEVCKPWPNYFTDQENGKRAGYRKLLTMIDQDKFINDKTGE